MNFCKSVILPVEACVIYDIIERNARLRRRAVCPAGREPTMRKLLCLLLCLSFLCLPALAQEQTATLEERFLAFLDENDLDGAGLSVSFYNTVTDERLDYRADRFHSVGRIWTLPLHMYYSEQEHAGAFDPPANDPEQVFTIDGLTLEKCRYQSILLGNDELSGKMRDRLGTVGQYQRLINEEYGRLEPDDLPDDFFTDTVYSTAFLLNCLISYHRQPELFGSLMGNFHQVQTSEGFGDTSFPYYMTHIRGVSDGRFCDVGIVNAPQPYLLACFATRARGGDETLSKVNAFFSAEIAEASGQPLDETTSDSDRRRPDGDFHPAEGRHDRRLMSTTLLRWVGIAFGAALVLGGVLTAVCLLVRRCRRRRIAEYFEPFDDEE